MHTATFLSCIAAAALIQTPGNAPEVVTPTTPVDATQAVALARDAMRFENEFGVASMDLRRSVFGELALFGSTVPFVDDERGALVMTDAEQVEIAAAHRAAVRKLTALAAETRELTSPEREDPIGQPDPITLRGDEARPLVAGLLGLDPARLGARTDLELSPRRSGRRVTYQIVADLLEPTPLMDSATLDLRGTFSLLYGPDVAYGIHAEGLLTAYVPSQRAQRQRIGCLDHRVELAISGLRPEPIAALDR